MRRITMLLLAMLMLAALTIPVFATTPKIVDNADLLTDSEEADLEAKAQALADRYEMDVVILTVAGTNGQYIEAYADDYYDNNGYGIGPDYSGVLLMLAMDTREWAISTCGEAIQALPDWTIESLFEVMADNLSSGNYGKAFAVYLQELEDLIGHYRDSQVVDAGDYVRIILVSLFIGAAVGGIAILVMRGQMNTAKAQNGAASYLMDGSFRMNRHLDLFLYSRVNKTRRQQNNGGSSVHRSSSGRSHGGGHGRF